MADLLSQYNSQKYDSGLLLSPPHSFVLCSTFHRLPIVLLFLLTSHTPDIKISLNTHLTQQHKIFRIFKHTEMFKILETDAQTCSLKRHFQKIQRKTLVVDSFLSPSKAVGELN